ncbi:hypothetical protein RMATCC62417_11343 [Rhizopus microsporus]|nr:hypothetical protein RMATCC62417_11343 [Rhizopus microsporus]
MANLKHVAPHSPYVAILLDQEKAYDRVHPEYLSRVLLQFGFSSSLVSCLSPLFSNTRISVSINGWLGEPVPQLRELRQGDPLSLLLFNFAFEPLLRPILSCQLLTGASLHPIPIQSTQKPSPLSGTQMATANNPTDFASQTYEQPPQPVKLLSYADNLEVFLAHLDEWPVLLHLLDTYGKASNTRVNLQKTVYLSLRDISSTIDEYCIRTRCTMA